MLRASERKQDQPGTLQGKQTNKTNKTKQQNNKTKHILALRAGESNKKRQLLSCTKIYWTGSTRRGHFSHSPADQLAKEREKTERLQEYFTRTRWKPRPIWCSWLCVIKIMDLLLDVFLSLESHLHVRALIHSHPTSLCGLLMLSVLFLIIITNTFFLVGMNLTFQVANY